MSSRGKVAAALLIHHPLDERRILVVNRPHIPGEDLPGIWGLPAASCQPGECLEETARRAARQKLGLVLQDPPLPLVTGTQGSQRGLLTMTLYKAVPKKYVPVFPAVSEQERGSTYYTDWCWSTFSILEEGFSNGSICCRLALSLSREE